MSLKDIIRRLEGSLWLRLHPPCVASQGPGVPDGGE